MDTKKGFLMSEAMDWLTVKQAAEALKLDVSTLYRLCRARKIRHRRIGNGAGRIVFTQSDLAAYLDSCVVEVGPEPEPTPLPVRLRNFRPQGSRRA
jgi:excisionase family DNA binding protein